AGHAHAPSLRLQFLRGPALPVGELRLQLAGEGVRTEIAWEDRPGAAAQGAQLLSALGDHMVLIGGLGRLLFVAAHCWLSLGGWIGTPDAAGTPDGRGAQAASLRLVPASRPALRAASTNSSRSPSRTLSVSLRSTPVRRSLMRDWSST